MNGSRFVLGTDAALVSGLAWVMITENLVDQPFLDKYCVGYDEKTLPAGAPANGHYKAYILGRALTVSPKRRSGPSTITGIPRERIVKLAREIATAKPAYISRGLGSAASRQRRDRHPRHLNARHSDG